MSNNTFQDLFKEETFYTIDYHTLENLIEEHYGYEEYSIPCNEECGNDVSLDLTVVPEPLDPDAYGANEPGYQYYLSEILNDLCYNGLIKPGNYLVKVTW